MEQKNMKIFVWIIVIIVGLGVIALIIGGVNHFNEVSKVVDEIKEDIEMINENTIKFA